MIFSTPIFNLPFESGENEIPVLVIENKNMYRQIITDLFLEQEGKISEHAFFIDDKEISLKKDVELIVDFFSLNINQTRNLTKLYSFIKSDIINEEKYLETTELVSQIMKYMNTIISAIDFKLIYDENIEIQNIFKVANLRFHYEESTLLEKFLDHLKIMNGFLDKKIFVLSNFKNTFSDNEQQEIYKFAFYNKINIFLIESIEPSQRLPNEKYRIIDNDQCVIY